jgi:hypothetical protein
MFGVPCRAPRGQGRPEFEVTPENLAQFNELLLDGLPQKDIAETLGITAKTLRKHFSPQLYKHAIVQRRARLEVRMTLRREMLGGNVAAAKALEAMRERDAARALSDRMLGKAAAAHSAEREAKAGPRLGKKEEAKLAAQGIEGLFAPRSAPAGAVK